MCPYYPFKGMDGAHVGMDLTRGEVRLNVWRATMLNPKPGLWAHGAGHPYPHKGVLP